MPGTWSLGAQGCEAIDPDRQARQASQFSHSGLYCFSFACWSQCVTVVEYGRALWLPATSCWAQVLSENHLCIESAMCALNIIKLSAAHLLSTDKVRQPSTSKGPGRQQTMLRY